MSVYFILMPIVFIVGILCIAFEDKIKINKGAISLTMCVVLWSMLLFNQAGGMVSDDFVKFVQNHKSMTNMTVTEQAQEYVSNALTMNLGDVSGTLFFLLCTMLIIDTVDKYGGFKAITRYLCSSNKRVLLWKIAFASFFFSALLDNIGASIIVIAVLRKIVPNNIDRIKYACMAIICCNAGGSWSPIGDVTTLLLWTNGRLTPIHQILMVFIPALVNMMVPLIIANFWLFKKNAILRVDAIKEPIYDQSNSISSKYSKVMFYLGMLSLVLIPFYQTLFHIPAFMGAIIGVILVWIYSEIMFHNYEKNSLTANKLRVSKLMHDMDLSTIFYFLGVLMSVAALETSGHLEIASKHIGEFIPNTNVLAFVIGGLSSVLDNVALVAGVLGMYPIDNGILSSFIIDSNFWTFLAYCGVTGGSLLIIGSATGVTIMGLENISFLYYLKRFSLLALVGYISGAIVQLGLFLI